MHERRPFIISSLDDDADKFMRESFMYAAHQEPLLYQSAMKMFVPAFIGHVDKWGYEAAPLARQFNRSFTNDWLKGARQYPLFSERQINKEISYLPTTEDAYDGSKFNFLEADELTQWRPLWSYKRLDLSLSIKKLLKMDVVFAADHAKLLEWLKTRGKPIFLTGSQYHNLTNSSKYIGGMFIQNRHRRLSFDFINASFKTY
jgi:hypothetical protein